MFNKKKDAEEVDLKDGTNQKKAFNKYSDGRFQRRRSRSKSIDVNALQSALAEMGYEVTMTELFELVKQYESPNGEPGKIGNTFFFFLFCFCLVIYLL